MFKGNNLNVTKSRTVLAVSRNGLESPIIRIIRILAINRTTTMMEIAVMAKGLTKRHMAGIMEIAVK
jgi:hypothetical protein